MMNAKVKYDIAKERQRRRRQRLQQLRQQGQREEQHQQQDHRNREEVLVVVADRQMLSSTTNKGNNECVDIDDSTDNMNKNHNNSSNFDDDETKMEVTEEETKERLGVRSSSGLANNYIMIAARYKNSSRGGSNGNDDSSEEDNKPGAVHVDGIGSNGDGTGGGDVTSRMQWDEEENKPGAVHVDGIGDGSDGDLATSAARRMQWDSMVSGASGGASGASPPPHPIPDEMIVDAEEEEASTATVFLEAEKVEEINVEEEVERRLQEERMRQGEALVVNAVRIDSKVKNLYGEEDEEDHNGGCCGRKKQKKKICLWILFAFVVLVGIGIFVGIAVGMNVLNTNGQQEASTTTGSDSGGGGGGTIGASPTTTNPTPTTDACLFCVDGAQPPDDDEYHLSTTVVSQSPFLTCLDIMNEMSAHTRNDKECHKLQAYAAWKCGGCGPNKNVFPPVPSNPVCTFCGPNERIVFAAKTTSSTSQQQLQEQEQQQEFCDNGNKWLAIVGDGTSRNVCDSYRLSVENANCICEEIPDDDDSSNGDEVEDNACIKDLSLILGLEAGITNTTNERTYILCPDTTYSVGFARNVGSSSATNALITGGQLPITSKSNVKILCGIDGKLDNNCTIQNGEIGVLYTAGHVFQDHPTIDNIWIQGVTFRNLGCIPGIVEECQDDRAGGAGISIFTPTNITIIDCIFEDFRDLVIEYDAWRAQYSERIVENNLPISYHATIRIYNSVFRNNGWLKPSMIISESDGPTGRSLISVFNNAIDSPAHDWSVGSISLEVVGCIFEGNTHYTSIIDFDGGDRADLTIRDCCFRNNTLSQFNYYDGNDNGDSSWAAPVLVGGDDRRRTPPPDGGVSFSDVDININTMNIVVEVDEDYIFADGSNGGNGGVCGIHPKYLESSPPNDSIDCVKYFSGDEKQVCGSAF